MVNGKRCGIRMRNKNKRSKLLFLLLLFIFGQAPQLKAGEDIAVIVGEDYNVYSLALAGFKTTYTGNTVEYLMHGDVEEGKKIVRKIESQSPRLILTIGNKATQIAKLNISNIPIVFSLVINPEQYDIEGKNICGVRLDIHPKDQIQMLKVVAPQVRKLGVIYNPDKSSNIVKEAEKAVNQLGIELIAIKAKSLSDVTEGIRALEGKIDAFWMIIDPLVANNDVFKKLLLVSLSERIGLIVPAQAFVKEGGLLAIDVDYKKIGIQTGEMVNQILSGSTTPEAIGIKSPEGIRPVINLTTAQSIGWTIPKTIIDQAVVINK